MSNKRSFYGNYCTVFIRIEGTPAFGKKEIKYFFLTIPRKTSMESQKPHRTIRKPLQNLTMTCQTIMQHQKASQNHNETIFGFIILYSVFADKSKITC